MKERLHLAASDFSTLHRPSTCERRVFLTARAVPGGEPSELETIIMEMGRRHEADHLATFPAVRNLGEGSQADRAQRTRDAVQSGEAVIYQGVLRAAFPGTRDIVTGIPDFMIRDVDSYRIRDCKLARSLEGGRHPEIVQQLQTYGWLFESAFNRAPAALEAYLGDGTLVTVPYAGAGPAAEELARIRELALRDDEPWEPVGWSKCGGCPFHDRCWSRAESEHDVSLVYRVDSSAARALRARGIRTWDGLLSLGEGELAALSLPRARGERRIGASAGRILAQARALAAGKPVRLGRLSGPEGACLVLFDLEGAPPGRDELERVSIWGMSVHDGGRRGAYRPAVAGFGAGGDREGWEMFLQSAESIFREHGEVPFVHWADYEKSKIRAYIERHGDRNGVGARVLSLCFDLLAAVRDAFALPVPSYSLKVIEGLAGFKRTMSDYGGDWAIARYLRAGESRDARGRASIMEEILRYNEEDLAATWRVLQWARDLDLTLPALPGTAGKP